MKVYCSVKCSHMQQCVIKGVKYSRMRLPHSQLESWLNRQVAKWIILHPVASCKTRPLGPRQPQCLATPVSTRITWTHVGITWAYVGITWKNAKITWHFLLQHCLFDSLVFQAQFSRQLFAVFRDTWSEVQLSVPLFRDCFRRICWGVAGFALRSSWTGAMTEWTQCVLGKRKIKVFFVIK